MTPGKIPFNSLPRRRAGILSTRLESTDGVTLETAKWVEVLQRLNCEAFFFAGACEWDGGRSHVVEEAHFQHPAIRQIYDTAFNNRVRPPILTAQIYEMKDFLKGHIRSFVKNFGIQVLVVENALAIPLNLPLGLALTEFIAETGIVTIAHHHDFFWERKRFLVNCVWDYLNMAFPPHLPTIHHVVINSSAANQLSLRTGISSTLIPNVMDFENPPPPPDDYTQDIRQALDVATHEKLLLQPTRVVPRKGIEHTIQLALRLDMPTKLIISHASGDEGHAYQVHLREFAADLNVPVHFVSDIIREKRSRLHDGRKVYTLSDLYPYADLVTYPSDIEGFGNAFLEAVYFRRPIVVNNYSIYDVDIKPKGFKVIEFDGFIRDETVEKTRRVLENPELVGEMTEHNYRRARRYYSYTTLGRRLHTLLVECFGEE